MNKRTFQKIHNLILFLEGSQRAPNVHLGSATAQSRAVYCLPLYDMYNIFNTIHYMVFLELLQETWLCTSGVTQWPGGTTPLTDL